MEKKTLIYKQNKLLKLYENVGKKGTTNLLLFTVPKNFRKNIDEAEQAVAKQKTKKRKYINLIFFLLNLVVIAVIMGIQIGQSEDMSITTLLNSTFSLDLFIFILLVWIIIQMIEAYRTNILIKQSTGKSRYFLAYKTNSYGKYYDCITPMASGGQPFQILYMTQRGLNASSAISVPMGKYVIYQLCLSIIWTLAIIMSFTVDLGGNFAYIRPLCIFGWVINAVFMVAIILLSVNQRIGKKLVAWTLKLLQKLKLIKNYEKQYNQVIKVVTDFQTTIKNFAKKKGTFIILIITCVLVVFLSYSFPFLVYSCLIGYFDFSMFVTLLLLSILIDIAVSFVPLPGGTGVSEISFTALFAVVFTNNVMLTWALLIWRFFTYYINIVQGIAVLTYDNVIGNKKYLWLKKKWELEAESMNFTEEKLHEFSLEKNKHKNKII